MRPRPLTPYGVGWCWFSGPTAHYLPGTDSNNAGRIFTGWLDMRQPDHPRVIAASIDDDLAAGFPVRETILSERTEPTTRDMVTADDHANPAVIVRGPQGGEKPVGFWVGHGGPQLSYRIASTAQDVAAFAPVQVVPTPAGPYGTTYANVWQLGDQRVYVLFRGAPDFQPYITRATSLGAANFEPARHLISAPAGMRPYVKAVAATPTAGTLHLAYTDGHPRDAITSIYHAKFSWTTGAWKRSDSSPIASWTSGLPFPATSGTRIHPGTDAARCWIWDIQVAPPDYEPRVLYAVIRSRTWHELWTAKHVGGGVWQREQLAEPAGGTIASDQEEHYSGGGCLDPVAPDRRLWVSMTRDGVHDLAQFEQTSPGAGWSFAGWVAEPSDEERVRPVAVRDHPSGRLLWLQGRYRSFTSLGTRVMLGAPLEAG